jgi:hypothetical protein
MSMADSVSGRVQPFALASAFVSDLAVFRELLAIPGVRLYELPMSPGLARVAARVLDVREDAAALQALKAPVAAGVSPRSDALAVHTELDGLAVSAQAHPARAMIARAEAGRLDVRADGPGLLVLAEGYDPGWSAAVDGAPARVLRVNHAQLGVALEAGTHRVTLRYRARGFSFGLALAAAGLGILAASDRVLASPARVSSAA